MAMSSAAFGASYTDVNANLAEAIKDYNYEVEQGFTLIAIIDLAKNDNSTAFFTFTEGWYLYEQANQYFGVNLSSNVDSGPSNWAVPNEGTLRTDGFEGAVTVGTTATWLVGSVPSQKVTLTISSNPVSAGDSTQYTTGIGLTNPNQTLFNITLLDKESGQTVYFDLNEVQFREETTVDSAMVVLNGKQIDLVNYVAPVPEPTTATLSLLALAGLAARRRRR